MFLSGTVDAFVHSEKLGTDSGEGAVAVAAPDGVVGSKGSANRDYWI